MNAKHYALSVAVMAATAASAATIGKVVVNQMWPWSTKVAIDYELTCNPGETWDVSLTVKDAQNNDVTGLSNAIYGDIANVAGGAHRLIWDPGRSLATGTAPVLSYTLSLREPLGKKYMIVDLTRDGEGKFSVSYLDEEPSGGFNTDTYKTTKMVFRRCPAGSFMMGSPEDEPERNKFTNNGEQTLANMERQHKVTLTRDFYLGLFEVTEGQSYLIWNDSHGAQSSSAPLRGLVPWNFRQPSATSYNHVDWAASTDVESDSFVGQFRAGISGESLISGYVFDLPTEAQWEYACRAGTTNVWNNDGPWSPTDAYDANNEYVGDLADLTLDTLGRYRYSIYNETHKQRNGPVAVGTFQPNAWGFYDMHGNVMEICLDAWPTTGNDGSDAMDPVLGVGVVGARVARGGCWSLRASYCRSAAKNRVPVQTANTSAGVRLALVPERPAAQ